MNSKYRDPLLDLRPYFELLPEIYLPNAYIAGGAAADYSKCMDVDIYLFLDPKAYKKRDVSDLIDRIVSKNLQFEVLPKAANPYHPSFNLILRVEFKKGVEVMIVDNSSYKYDVDRYGSVDIKLFLNRTFDISAHATAIDCGGMRHNAGFYTLPSEPIEVYNSEMNRVKTLERYLKLCRRYGSPLKRSIVDELVNELPY